MSLLNTTNDGLHNVLVAFCRLLIVAKGESAEADLMRKIALPSIAHENGRLARSTLNKWVDLGLLIRDDEKIRLSEYFPRSWKAMAEDIEGTVRRAARKCALSAVNNDQLWAYEASRAADFTRALSLLLAQDIYRTGFADLERCEIDQVSESNLRLLGNGTRTNGLKKWAHFLGFLRNTDGKEIDPTVAVRESIEWMPLGQRVQAHEFLARLASDLPVLDGGQYRLAVEEKLDPSALVLPQGEQLSTSLSRALICLKADGTLGFEFLSDAASGMIFCGQNGPRVDVRYTHVTRLERHK